MPRRAAKVRVLPVTPERWPDLQRLFGPRGACAGCWCMWWRLPPPEWTAGKGEGNRRKLRALVRAGAVPGLLAYDGEEPVGWVAVAPREEYPRVLRSRTLRPVDDAAAWAISCFFVARAHRGRGLTRLLAGAAVRHAARHGARIVEAYPVDSGKPLADAWLYTGAASTFRSLGFGEAARRSRSRPVLRRAVRPGGARARSSTRR